MSGLASLTELIEIGRAGVSENLLSRDFDVHGVSTRLTTNSAAAADAVSAFLKPFQRGSDILAPPRIEFFLFAGESLEEKAGSPENAPLLYDWGPVKIYHAGPRRYLELDTRARVSSDYNDSRAVGFVTTDALDSPWLISHQVFYPLWAQLIKAQGLFPFHAAGVVKDGRAFIFPGRSGSGKSTLTLRLVKNGYGYLSDDTVFLREEDGAVEALSFPEEVNVTEETRRLVPELARVRSFNQDKLRQKTSFAIDELYPGCLEDKGAPSMILFPEITGAAETAVLPMTRTEALAFSMRFGFFFIDPSTTARHFEILSILVKQARCFRLLSGSDPGAWEQVISDALGGVHESV